MSVLWFIREMRGGPQRYVYMPTLILDFHLHLSAGHWGRVTPLSVGLDENVWCNRSLSLVLFSLKHLNKMAMNIWINWMCSRQLVILSKNCKAVTKCCFFLSKYYILPRDNQVSQYCTAATLKRCIMSMIIINTGIAFFFLIQNMHLKNWLTFNLCVYLKLI